MASSGWLGCFREERGTDSGLFFFFFFFFFPVVGGDEVVDL